MIKTKDFVSAILGLVFLGWVLLNFLAIKYIVFLGLGFLGLVLLNILVVQDREAWIEGFLDSTFVLLVGLGWLAYLVIASLLIVGIATYCIIDIYKNGYNWGSLLLLLFAVPFGIYLAIYIPNLLRLDKKNTLNKLPLTWIKEFLVGFWIFLLMGGMVFVMPSIIFASFGLLLFWAVDCILKLLPPIGFWGNVLVYIAVLFGIMFRLTPFFISRLWAVKKKDTTEKLPLSPLHFLHPTSGLLMQNKDTTEQ
jgi:hypothetical protein